MAQNFRVPPRRRESRKGHQAIGIFPVGTNIGLPYRGKVEADPDFVVEIGGIELFDNEPAGARQGLLVGELYTNQMAACGSLTVKAAQRWMERLPDPVFGEYDTDDGFPGAQV